MRRFFKYLSLNTRQIIRRQLPLFCLIFLILAWMFLSVDRAISNSLRNYDYAKHFFDRTEEDYAALILYPTYSSNMSSNTWPGLRQNLTAAAGQEPLVARRKSQIKEAVILPDGTVDPSSLDQLMEDTNGQGSIYAYPPGLLGIVPNMQKGRWLTVEDKDCCVICPALEEWYPLGSEIQRKGKSWLVVGVLAPEEKPIHGTFTDGTLSLSTVLRISQHSGSFMIIPMDPDPRDWGYTMWFRLEEPIEDLRERLSSYGYVLSPEELVQAYLDECLRQVFLRTPRTLFLLFLSLVVSVTIMVINFGRSRQQYAVMCLLGQSQRMLTGCVCTVYTATVLAAYGLSRLCLALKIPASVVGQYPSISVAHLAVAGVTLLSVLCVNAVVLIFFRRSPMTLFTENK